VSIEKSSTVNSILSMIKDASGSNDKKRILQENSENQILKKLLQYATDPFLSFNIVKVPKTEKRRPVLSEDDTWSSFFSVADLCSSRAYTGNDAISLMSDIFSVVKEEDEKWMRKVLKKHLAIGVSVKTLNKVFPGLVKTFDVSLAQKFEKKRIKGMTEVAVEPKLDGIRCFAIVKDGEAKLFARSGKLIQNFDNTIGKELKKLGTGCYDGELMGSDFTSLMRQAYRKENIDLSETYLALFDYLPENEWLHKETVLSCKERYKTLVARLSRKNIDSSILSPVERHYVKPEKINALHDKFVASGYEGAMVKDPSAVYRFGRGYEVMKLKAFHDVDLPIKGLLEGTGKHSGKLGSVVVSFNGVDVQVGSGFSDELRSSIWDDKDSFIDRIIEVRYQEVTPDGSLRFPTFVCFRNDK
tara:strand:- start:4155 stop:5396 length:1242 start_codon:yes stop_codon:yes gene_type:complete